MYRRIVRRSIALICAVVSGCAAPAVPDAPASATVAGLAAPSTTALPRPAASPPAATFEPAVTESAASRPDQAAHNMTLVGALAIEPQLRGAHGDVAVFKQLAFLGSGTWTCQDSGVSIVDLTDPARPERLATTTPRPGMGMEDMAALSIGERDVLVIGLQICDGARTGGVPTGIDLVDITDPRQPQHLATFETDGVHELGVTQTPDGRSLALLAVPGMEERTADENGIGGVGDLLIVDISDPMQPWQLAEWGVMDAPELGPQVFKQAAQGDDPAVFLHSVRPNTDGTRLFLSYWDAGVIVIDITDPAQPRYRGRTDYAPFDEGNAHSIAISEASTLLVEANEDLSPTTYTLASNAFPEKHPILFHDISSILPEGEIAAVGRGCPAGSVPGQAGEDAYMVPISDTIALIEPGGCAIELKLARAQDAGAEAIIVYDEITPALVDLVVRSLDVGLPDGSRLSMFVPVIVASDAAGRALAAAPAPVTIQIGVGMGSWGGLRLFDLGDPAQPQLLSTFKTANTLDEETAWTAGFSFWSAHNPELIGDLLLASWYLDGVRAIDVGDPRQPQEIGFWTGAGLPGDAPPVDIWGIAPYEDLIVASDRNVGLYVLRLDR